MIHSTNAVVAWLILPCFAAADSRCRSSSGSTHDRRTLKARSFRLMIPLTAVASAEKSIQSLESSALERRGHQRSWVDYKATRLLAGRSVAWLKDYLAA